MDCSRLKFHNEGMTSLFWVDLLKAIAIFLVTAGHVSGILNFASFWHGLIYSFHMPLFFAISGFLAAKSIKTGLGAHPCGFKWGWAFIIRKFERLIVPYFCWLILFSPMFLHGDARMLPEGCGVFSRIRFLLANHGLWYLPCLFALICSFLGYALLEKKFGYRVLFALYPGFSIFFFHYLSKVADSEVFANASIYVVPFFLGAYFGKYEQMLAYVVGSRRLLTISLLVFCLTAAFFIKGTCRHGMNWPIWKLTAGCASVLVAFPVAVAAGQMTALAAFRRAVSRVARDTLVIYAMGNPFIRCFSPIRKMLWNVPAFGQLLLLVVLSIVVIAFCTVAGLVFRASPILSRLFLGMQDKR